MQTKRIYLFLSIALINCGMASGQTWKEYKDSALFFKARNNFSRTVHYYGLSIDLVKKDSMVSVTYAQLYNDLGNLYYNFRQFDKAEECYLETRRVREIIFGTRHPEYGKILSNLGTIAKMRKQFDKAENLYKEAIEIHTGKDLQGYVNACYNIGIMFHDLGKLVPAEQYLTSAMNVVNEKFGKSSPYFLPLSVALGTIYFTTNAYDKAEKIWLESLSGTTVNDRKKSVTYGDICNNLGILYYKLTQTQKGLQYAFEAREIYTLWTGKQDRDYAINANSIGLHYFFIGELEKAETYLTESKETFESISPSYKSDPGYALACENLANLYNTSNRPEKALPLYLTGLEIQTSLYGENQIPVIQVQQNLASLYFRMGKKRLYDSLILASKKGLERINKEDFSFWLLSFNIGTYHFDKEENDSAGRYYDLTFQSQQNDLTNIFRFTAEEEKLRYVESSSFTTDYYYSLYYLHPTRENKLKALTVSYANRNKVLDNIKMLRNTLSANMGGEILDKFENWVRLREELAGQITSKNNGQKDSIAALSEKSRVLEKELTAISNEFRSRQEMVKLEDIRQALGPADAGVEFFHFQLQRGGKSTDSILYGACILKKETDEPEMVILFEKKQLTSVLKAQGGNNVAINFYYSKTGKSGSSALYDLIWKPLLPSLANTERIYYAPAGLLHTISFDAIRIKNKQTLSDQYRMIRLGNTASIAQLDSSFIAASDTLHLFGNIYYDADSSAIRQAVLRLRQDDVVQRSIPDDLLTGKTAGKWDLLPNSEFETRKIETMAKGKGITTYTFSKLDANEETIKFWTPKFSPNIIHFSTHGFFFPDPAKRKVSLSQISGQPYRQSDNPMFRSAIILAGANNAWNSNTIKGVQDGILTAYEVSNLNLPRTKLVVLSACKTGLGDIQGSEGVYGLQRAFKIAGVKNLVMSLWDVPDKETAEFMTEFYKHMFEGKPVEDAFYNTQQKMKNKYREEPYKWAAWILVR